MTLFFIILILLVAPLSIPLYLDYKKNPKKNIITKCMAEAETFAFLTKVSKLAGVHQLVILTVLSMLILLLLCVLLTFKG